MQMQPWLTTQEQEEVLENLIRFGGDLLKWDNARKLPLKSGGCTDIYINLRNERNSPLAARYIAQIYRNPLLRLEPDVLAEVPDAVSGIAAHLSQLTRIPRITIREKEKAGRATDGVIIGTARAGQSVSIMDDVITDGKSKIVPYHKCHERGLKVGPLVVLVDRQQGWKKVFRENNIRMDVWPGMTLHDVRRFLINEGYMQRCAAQAEEQNPLIIALDGKEWEDILPLVDVLRPMGCILKVNDLLFHEGMELIPNLQVYGRVMADLKNHDIPKTVENTCKRLRKYAPWAVTVHASGSGDMISAAVAALEGTPTKVLAVTVLTSFDEKASKEVYNRRSIEEVRKLAWIAHQSGAHGLVCSPKEVAEMKKFYPRMTFVTPGVRSAGVDVADQKRVDTPAAALESGADYLVMGRQILGAPDPTAEVQRLLKEEIWGAQYQEC